MSTDEVKGRIKEAAGDLTDDDDLKNEGKLDKAAGTRSRTPSTTSRTSSPASDPRSGRRTRSF